jgi:single-strand DNA-binding protein
LKTLNRVFLIGNTGKDPELKSTGGGTLVANLSLATSERRKDAHGNWQDEATWHNLVAFGKIAEVIRDYVQKGTPLHIEGRISNRSWEKDGQKHFRSEVIIESLVLLGGGNKEKRQASPAQEPEIDNDLIPF